MYNLNDFDDLVWNAINMDGDFALIKASGRKSSTYCRLLIKGGFDVNIQNGDKNTALTTAAKHNALDNCKLLIEAGCNLNLYGRYGPAIFLAVKNKNIRMCKMLIDAGCNLRLRDNFGKNISDHAKDSFSETITLIKLLDSDYFINDEVYDLLKMSDEISFIDAINVFRSLGVL